MSMTSIGDRTFGKPKIPSVAHALAGYKAAGKLRRSKRLKPRIPPKKKLALD